MTYEEYMKRRADLVEEYRRAAALGVPLGSVIYTREDVRRAGWQARRPELVEAMKAGRAVLLDE